MGKVSPHLVDRFSLHQFVAECQTKDQLCVKLIRETRWLHRGKSIWKPAHIKGVMGDAACSCIAHLSQDKVNIKSICRS